MMDALMVHFSWLTADWANAISTFLAVFVALWVAGIEGRRKAKADKYKQAELISGWMIDLPHEENIIEGKIYVNLLLRNASDQLVYNLVASVVTANGNHVGGNLDYRNYIGRLPPGQSEYRIEHPGHGMSKRFSVELAFNDASSRIWLRCGKGTLKQIRKGPLEFYDISPPVGWLMP